MQKSGIGGELLQSPDARSGPDDRGHVARPDLLVDEPVERLADVRRARKRHVQIVDNKGENAPGLFRTHAGGSGRSGRPHDGGRGVSPNIRNVGDLARFAILKQSKIAFCEARDRASIAGRDHGVDLDQRHSDAERGVGHVLR